MSVKENFKTYIPSVIGLTLVFASFVIMVSVSNSRTQSLSQLEGKKVQLQNKIDQMSVQKLKLKQVV